MPDILQITNHGPLITASNYWQTEHAQRGLLYLSTNAGALRLLVPLSQRHAISDMRPGAKHVVVSILAGAAEGKTSPDGYVAEWLVEDGSDSPWSCHLSLGQLDRIPTVDDVGREWIATVWDEKNGRPHKCLERPAYVQIVPHLPWLKKITA